jgi:site-specific DNA-methyltransferase (adenine-specific)
MTYRILHGNNLDVLPTLADNSIDSIVTDPPYEISFMSKSWDGSGIAYSVELWQQCLRVLKPGGHLLSFGGTRTYHRVAVAIEDAGFELRDSIAWLYGSGFPKSLDVSKAIDKAAGAEREVIGEKVSPDGIPYSARIVNKSGPQIGGSAYGDFQGGGNQLTAPATPEAQQWQGWGTALKPAFEPVIVARKPIEGTVANNVLKWGTGGLNIDASRIGFKSPADQASATPQGKVTSNSMAGAAPDVQGLDRKEIDRPDNSKGRWPANIILDPYTAELLDEQSGDSSSKAANKGLRYSGNHGGLAGQNKEYKEGTDGIRGFSDSGGASRFFYVAKASKRDRNEGLEELPEKIKPYGNREIDDVPEEGDRPGSVNDKFTTQPAKNFHPTVKPTSLMEYLIKLVTPPNGTVLDPFTGSGSTGKAAILQGFDFIGIEMTEEYLPIIEGRLKHAEAIVAERIKEASLLGQEKLF